MSISDEEVLEKVKYIRDWIKNKPQVCDTEDFRKFMERERKIKFTLSDLVGKTIVEHRKIRNKDKYNPDFTSPNPDFFNLLLFQDSFLMTEGVGMNDWTELRCYYFDGKEVKYSDELFS